MGRFPYYCWAPSQYMKRRLFVRSRKVSKPRDLYLELSDRSEIWQALRQHCRRCAYQIAKRYDNLKYQSRGFETSRDLTKRRLFGYWDGALVLWVGNPLLNNGYGFHSQKVINAGLWCFLFYLLTWTSFCKNNRVTDAFKPHCARVTSLLTLCCALLSNWPSASVHF